MSSGYLVYHPKPQKQDLGPTIVVHCDKIRSGNQDPYVWNTQFLQTFCKITKMSPEKDDICFWVSRGSNPKCPQLFCDLVFVVDIRGRRYWKSANTISRKDSIVDSDEAWNDHYYWGNLNEGQPHYFKIPRRRFTLKADPKLSFQPQDRKGALIDIAPFLQNVGYNDEKLWNRGMRPFRIDDVALRLYDWICHRAATKLRGEELWLIRRKNPSLASSDGHAASCC